MTAFMLDMMVAMMPYMKPLLWLGVGASAFGLFMAMLKPVLGNNPMRRNAIAWSGRIAFGLGIFFLACQVMGAILGAAPEFNLGDASKFEFWMVPFWQVGAVFVFAGLLLGNILAPRTHAW